jgi:hypothetical protein
MRVRFHEDIGNCPQLSGAATAPRLGRFPSMPDLSSFRAPMRIYAIVAVAMIMTVGLAPFLQFRARDRTYQDRATHVSDVVATGVSVARRVHDLAAAGEMPEDDAKAQALAIMADLRFAGGNCLWVHDMSGVMLTHGANPKLNGRNLIDLEDPNAVKIFSGDEPCDQGVWRRRGTLQLGQARRAGRRAALAENVHRHGGRPVEMGRRRRRPS